MKSSPNLDHTTMDYYSVLLFMFCSLSAFLVFLKSSFGSAKLPPGPKPLPIYGNIFQLGEKPHQSITALSKTYGPLMSFKLGSVATVVISSSDVAREIFQNNDLALSSRKIVDAVRACNHHNHSVGWLPVCPLWRNSRKIISIQLISSYRLNKTRFLREKKVADLLEYVRSCSNEGRPVNIGHAAFTTVLNLLSNTLFSLDMAHHTDDLSGEVKQLVRDLIRVLGRPNFADYFPIVRYLDPQGVRRQAAFYFNRLFAIFDGVINQRLMDPLSSSSSSNGDVLAALLAMSRENGSQVNLEHIRHLLFDLLVAGTDTTSSTLEWAMAELLHSPTKMEKAQAEIDEVLGKEVELVQESDISKLPYLEAVIKETLRVHPAAPLSIPRETATDVNMCGYSVPKGAQVLVNVWAIGRDPDAWGPNSESFIPERFLGDCGIDINRGLDHFEFMPFGVGRRICPGLPLAHRLLHLMLANLIHSFNWKLPDGMDPGQMDMTERLGMTLQKLQPLHAVPIPK